MKPHIIIRRQFVIRFGLAVALIKDLGSIPLRFSLLFKKVVVSGHCLVTLSLTINETIKWLSSLPISMRKSFWWWQRSDTVVTVMFRPALGMITETTADSFSTVGTAVSASAVPQRAVMERVPALANAVRLWSLHAVVKFVLVKPAAGLSGDVNLLPASFCLPHSRHLNALTCTAQAIDKTLQSCYR